jgi:hypothetical protein
MIQKNNRKQGQTVIKDQTIIDLFNMKNMETKYYKIR